MEVRLFVRTVSCHKQDPRVHSVPDPHLTPPNTFPPPPARIHSFTFGDLHANSPPTATMSKNTRLDPKFGAIFTALKDSRYAVFDSAECGHGRIASQLAAAILSVCLPNVVHAQKESYSGPMIHVDGHVPDRPSPPNRDYGGGRGGGDAGNRGQTPGTRGHPGSRVAAPAVRKVSVTLNGQTFHVSKEAEATLSDFLKTHQNHGNAGSIVAAIGSVFSLFGLLSLDNTVPAYDAALKLDTFDSKEVIVRLTAPGIWARFMRSRAAEICDTEYLRALTSNRVGDAKMWAHLRDVFANPERYKDGGLKYNRSPQSVELRKLPGESGREFDGFRYGLTGHDRVALSSLASFLFGNVASRDFLMQADFMFALHPTNVSMKPLSHLDRYLLNRALLATEESLKQPLERYFDTLSRHPTLTHSFWITLKKFVRNEAWDEDHLVLAGTSDDRPEQSDLITGDYPAVHLRPAPLPGTTGGPWTFEWRGGSN